MYTTRMVCRLFRPVNFFFCFSSAFLLLDGWAKTYYNRPMSHRAPPVLFLSIVFFIPVFLLSGPALYPDSREELQSTPEAMQAVDALGRTVKLAAPAQRVVLAGRGVMINADALYLFRDAADRLVGVGDFAQGSGHFLRDLDPYYREKAGFPRDAGPEQIAALRPDLVVLKSYMAGTLGMLLERVGITVAYADFETPEQYERDLALLGALLGEAERAGELIRFYRIRKEMVRQRLRDLPAEERPRVLLLSHSQRDGTTALSVPPTGWLQTDLVRMSGGEPVWTNGAPPGGGWRKVTVEQAAAWDPDLILVVSYFGPAEEAVRAMRNDPLWSRLRAAREGGILPFPGDYYSWDQPDPRWVLGLLWLARTLHPVRFSDLHMPAETERFFRFAYRMSPDEYRRLILPRLSGLGR